MTADRTASADHIDCPFRALQGGWEESKKEKPLARALYSWCQDEMFGDRLVKACRAHVKNKTWCEHGENLIETWDKDDPEDVLQGLLGRSDGPDVSEHELLMAWAHLRITKAWVEEGGYVPDQVLESLLSDVSKKRLSVPFGPSFFRALTRFLNPELSVKNQSDTRSDCSEASTLFPLVLDRSDETRIGRVQAHPSGRGRGRVFIHPEQAFLRLDNNFRATFDSAQALVGSPPSDVHVRIDPLGGRWESPVLVGKSVGGALYLSLKSVVEEEDVEGGTVTSFALSGEDHSPDGQCHPVERLRAKATGLSSYEGCNRFLISESQEEMLDKHRSSLEVLRARTLEKAWEHATDRLAELRRYLEHVEAEAEKTALHMDRRSPHVRVQARPTGSPQDTIEELELDRRDHVVSDSKIERGVILGDPGMGKTRLLKEEAKALAREALDHLSGDGLPDEVRIPIRLRSMTWPRRLPIGVVRSGRPWWSSSGARKSAQQN